MQIVCHARLAFVPSLVLSEKAQSLCMQIKFNEEINSTQHPETTIAVPIVSLLNYAGNEIAPLPKRTAAGCWLDAEWRGSKGRKLH